MNLVALLRVPRMRPLPAAGLLLLAAALAAPPAHAQDAANGKVLYDTPYGTQHQGCYSCHGYQGSVLVNNNKIANGANKPAVIQNAINSNTGGMGFLQPYLSSAQVADIAAYLGNPGLVGVGSPQAAASPASLSFAATAVGATSAAQTVTLSNAGSAALSLSAIATSTAAFRVTGGTCAAGGSVPAAGSCTVTVAFAPSAGDTASGTLTFTHNASPTTTAVALSGTGVVQAPVAAVSPASLTFSAVVGTPAAAVTATVSNTGNAPLVLGTLSFTGTAAADYALGASSTCASNGTVAAGASCTVAVVFTPAAAGSRPATLSIPGNAAGSPLAVTLAGTGTATPQAVLALDRNALDLGSTVVGSASAARPVTVSNTGSAAMTITGLSVSGANAGDFAATGCAPGSTVAAGASCAVSVTFTPSAAGARAASLDVATDASNNGGRASASLSGTGTTAPAPVAAATPSAIDYGTVTVGGAAVARTITLSNGGNAPLSLSGIAASGTGFTATNDCGTSLAAGASCTITAAFAPAAAGAASGTVAVTSNAAGSPTLVALSGTGSLQALPVLGWTTAPDGHFVDVATGWQSAPRAFVLGNPGPATATISALSVQGAQAGDFQAAGTCAAGLALAAGQSCTVLVTFAPAAVGPRSAVLDVLTDATNPPPVDLAGNGVAAAQSVLSLSAAAISFPDAPVGQAPAPVPLVLANAGTGPLTVTAMTVGSAVFSATPASGGCGAPPVTLAPGAQCAYDVSAAAATAGAYDSTLTIATDATTAPGPVALHVRIAAAPGGGAGFANSGAGGCSIAPPGQPADPVLAGLALVAAFALLLRRRRGHVPQGDDR